MIILWIVFFFFVVENCLLAIKYRTKFAKIMEQLPLFQNKKKNTNELVCIDDEENAWYHNDSPILILHGGV